MHDATTRIPLAAGSSKGQSAAHIIAFLQTPENASLLAHEEIAQLLAADLAKIQAGAAQQLPAHTTHALARRIRGIEREMQLKQRNGEVIEAIPPQLLADGSHPPQMRPEEIRQLTLYERTGDAGLLEQKRALLAAVETACRESRLVAASPLHGRTQR